jgi:hypothetical protein
MNNLSKILLAMQQVDGILNLMKGNEYEHYFVSHLIPIQVELKRQLTNLTHSTKIEEVNFKK